MIKCHCNAHVIIKLILRETGCGGEISQNSTHIQNTGFPSGYTSETSCVYTFKKSSLDICAIRLEFVVFSMRGPDVNKAPTYTNCDYDTVFAKLSID